MTNRKLERNQLLSSPRPQIFHEILDRIYFGVGPQRGGRHSVCDDNSVVENTAKSRNRTAGTEHAVAVASGCVGQDAVIKAIHTVGVLTGRAHMDACALDTPALINR